MGDRKTAADICISGLNVRFKSKTGDVIAVRDVSARFQNGSVTGLIGESGSGKSVLGMSILQLLPGTADVEGECLYQGQNLYACSEKEMCAIRGCDIALIPQNPSESLDPVQKIGRQLTEAALLRRQSDREQAAKRRDSLLRRFDFEDAARINGSYSFQLSGGMNQRVISALGLMNRPNWIIADEPTKGLDVILRKQVYHVLRDIAEQETRGMIVITHDLTLAGALCDRLMIMYKGVMLEQGRTPDLLEQPAHPYTQALIAALPERGMHPIAPPDPQRPDAGGCPFYPRCSQSCVRCADGEMPPERELGGGRLVRCHLYA